MKLYLTMICSFLFFAVNNITAQSLELTIPEESTIITTMEFEEIEFDFGTIESGDKVIHTFLFKNTGTEPLIISNAKGSCGCTVPFWPKEPIAPGASGEIEVQFNSKGKKGKQSKRVTLTANTKPTQSYLTIKGEVTAVPSEVSKKDLVSANKKAEKTLPLFHTDQDFKPVDCFAIYPNPTAEILNLDFKDHIGDPAIINIYNQSGKLIATKKIDAITESVVTFDVHLYPAGTYYTNIQIAKNAPSTKCFIVSK